MLLLCLRRRRQRKADSKDTRGNGANYAAASMGARAFGAAPGGTRWDLRADDGLAETSPAPQRDQRRLGQGCNVSGKSSNGSSKGSSKSPGRLGRFLPTTRQDAWKSGLDAPTFNVTNSLGNIAEPLARKSPRMWLPRRTGRFEPATRQGAWRHGLDSDAHGVTVDGESAKPLARTKKSPWLPRRTGRFEPATKQGAWTKGLDSDMHGVTVDGQAAKPLARGKRTNWLPRRTARFAEPTKQGAWGSGMTQETFLAGDLKKFQSKPRLCAPPSVRAPPSQRGGLGAEGSCSEKRKCSSPSSPRTGLHSNKI